METFLWVEKYRPKAICDCILPDDLKKTFTEFVNDKHIPNLILSGGPGVGKTTVAKAMLEEIGATYMMINGSEESGIDVLRTKIKNFASTVSLEGGRKYIILDEVNFDKNDLILIDEKAKKIISEFNIDIKDLTVLNKETLEPIINNLIKTHETNFKGVGQPLRIALTGSKFGPGIYDIIISLGKKEIEKRLRNKVLT